MPTPREMNWMGAATPLAAGDIEAVAASLNVDVPTLKAVLEVEAAGSGFDAEGRPKILFEGHVMWRNIVPEMREEANRAGVAWSHWEPGRYPRTSDAMYARLEAACDIDETAAMLACSWGIAQVLGENHKMVGFDTVEEMVLAAMDSERDQLEMMAAFIDAANLEVPLRALDWEGFAQGYNGPLYKVHGYHLKLQAAYERLVAEPVVAPPAAESDTPPLVDEPRAPFAWAPPPASPPGGQEG